MTTSHWLCAVLQLSGRVQKLNARSKCDTIRLYKWNLTASLKESMKNKQRLWAKLCTDTKMTTVSWVSCLMLLNDSMLRSQSWMPKSLHRLEATFLSSISGAASRTRRKRSRHSGDVMDSGHKSNSTKVSTVGASEIILIMPFLGVGSAISTIAAIASASGNSPTVPEFTASAWVETCASFSGTALKAPPDIEHPIKAKSKRNNSRQGQDGKPEP